MERSVTASAFLHTRPTATAVSATYLMQQQQQTTTTLTSPTSPSNNTSPIMASPKQNPDESTVTPSLLQTQDLPMDNDTDSENTAVNTAGSPSCRPRSNTTSSVHSRKPQEDACDPHTRPRAKTFSSGSLSVTENNPSKINLRSRINRHPVQEKVRHKRQTLQDMARPLKRWLYKNRDNPYPTKPEKLSLALGSEMTLVQVSNWFANARRRLKNTVQDNDMSWSTRIKKYNSRVQGNAELLSVSSEDSMWDSGEEADFKAPLNTGNQCNNNLLEDTEDVICDEEDEGCAQSSSLLDRNSREMQSDIGTLCYHNDEDAINTSTRSRNSSGYCSEDQSQPQKYKQTMLHRYLHDACDQAYTHDNLEIDTSMRMRYRCPSGSVSSHDFEDIASSRSTPTKEHRYFFDDHHEEVEEYLKQRRSADGRSEEEESLYYKEISAAFALTSLARNKYNRMTSSK